MDFLSLELNATFILNDLDLQMALTIEQALLEYKHVV